MARKTWIVIGLCVAVAAMLCAVAYGEKGEKKCSLPATVEAAVKALFPNAVIEKSEKEEEEVAMYEAKIKDGSKESDVVLAADGTVAEVESAEDINAVPAAVAQTIKAQDGKVSKVEKIVEYAQLKLVKLDTPITTYEAKIIKGKKTIEIKIAVDGKIIEQEVKKCDKEKDDDNGKDDDDKDKD